MTGRAGALLRWFCVLLDMLIAFAAALLGSSISHQQPATEVKVADLMADAETLRSAIRTLHPGRTRYLSEKQEAVSFRRLQEELEQGRSVGERYAAFTHYVAGFRCGHTFLNRTTRPTRFGRRCTTVGTSCLFCTAGLGRR